MLLIRLSNICIIILLSVARSIAAHQAGTEAAGLYSRRVRSFDIVVPRQVDATGRFLSHHLVRHHDLHLTRSKRDVAAQEPIYFALPIPGDANEKELVLQLWPSTRFIAPNLLVQRSRRSKKYKSEYSAPTTCHFQGNVLGDAASSVALSACNGLAGLVRSRRHGELWVEPVKGPRKTANSGEGHPHIVYRRSASKTPVKRRRKKNRISEKHCGTREPRRVVRLIKNNARHLHKKGYGNLRSFSRPIKKNNLLTDTFKMAFNHSSLAGEGNRRIRSVSNLPSAMWLRKLSSDIDDDDDDWDIDQEEEEEEELDLGGGAVAGVFSESIERHVEALVVADQSMLDFHQEDGGTGTDVEMYLLIVMNMVAAIFRDPSIGNRINIVVVKLIALDDSTKDGFNVTVNADVTLENFCDWQLKKNPPDDDTQHHDVAILVTRIDICAKSDTPCATLGVAHVGGMCHAWRSCSVNQDNGLTVAHTIAHELGHNFGMMHDTESESADCSSRNGLNPHVMTASMDSFKDEVAWSSCSRKAITRFLDQGGGECLLDGPTSPSTLQLESQLPAGARYSADEQCRLQFNASATGVCLDFEEEFCYHLWCIVDGSCVTLLKPPADGTHCGLHKWCMSRECVELRDAPTPVDGAWGEWGSWSTCSRSCGGGVTSSERQCDHPRPAFGGKYCLGLRKRYQVCNVQDCPAESPSFRAAQCAHYVDPKISEASKKKWLPFFDQSQPCTLFCTDAEQSIMVESPYPALDGTPCNASSRDMCIDGRCRRVGCDWRVESNAEEDSCGVCGGDGSRCETVSQEFTTREGSGYTEAAIIPEGARNIRVEELGNSRTFIALASSKSDLVYVDGKRWRSHVPREIQVAGSAGLYERWSDREILTLRGPTNESLKLYVIYHGRYRNLGLHYEYTVQRTEGEVAPEFYWGFEDWSTCSVTCGIGVQMARPVCLERLLGRVATEKCPVAPMQAPVSLMRTCSMSPCPASWWSGPWQLCPVTCGPAETTRHRSVLCVRWNWNEHHDSDEEEEFQALPDIECDEQTRPSDMEPCPSLLACNTDARPSTPRPRSSAGKSGKANAMSRGTRLERKHRKKEEALAREQQAPVFQTAGKAKFVWRTGDWGQCSHQCGGGSRKRMVSCHLGSMGHRVSGRHCAMTRPTDRESCNTRSCEEWLISPWSPCTADCQQKNSTRVRKVVCPRPASCDLAARPKSTESCMPAECIDLSDLQP